MGRFNVWTGAAALFGSIAGGILVKKLWLAKYREQAAVLADAERERDILYTWILLKEKGVELGEYFSTHRLKTVAILGMNSVGRRLYEELQGKNGLQVVYGVEAEHLGAVHEMLTVYRIEDDPLPRADCMVICDMELKQEKAEALQREFFGETVSLPDVMRWLLEQYHIEPRDGAIAGFK